MVLAHKVGKRRSFGAFLGLSILTFGIYSIYWHYKAHTEVHKQFELEKEGRSDGVVWLILGLLVSPLLYVYQYKFVDNVRYVRRRLGLQGGIGPGAFLGLVIGGAAIVLVCVFAMFAVLGAQDLPACGTRTTPACTPAERQQIASAFAGALPILLVGALLFLALVLVAYARLVSAINAVWDAYDARSAELARPPPPPPMAPASPTSSWAAPGAPPASAGTRAPTPPPPR